jgi:hypothetical protein
MPDPLLLRRRDFGSADIHVPVYLERVAAYDLSLKLEGEGNG